MLDDKDGKILKGVINFVRLFFSSVISFFLFLGISIVCEIVSVVFGSSILASNYGNVFIYSFFIIVIFMLIVGIPTGIYLGSFIKLCKRIGTDTSHLQQILDSSRTKFAGYYAGQAFSNITSNQNIKNSSKEVGLISGIAGSIDVIYVLFHASKIAKELCDVYDVKYSKRKLSIPVIIIPSLFYILISPFIVSSDKDVVNKSVAITVTNRDTVMSVFKNKGYIVDDLTYSSFKNASRDNYRFNVEAKTKDGTAVVTIDGKVDKVTEIEYEIFFDKEIDIKEAIEIAKNYILDMNNIIQSCDLKYAYPGMETYVSIYTGASDKFLKGNLGDTVSVIDHSPERNVPSDEGFAAYVEHGMRSGKYYISVKLIH